jgi:hypothetical protein
MAEKVAITAIANFYKVNELLHEGQFSYSVKDY